MDGTIKRVIYSDDIWYHLVFKDDPTRRIAKEFFYEGDTLTALIIITYNDSGKIHEWKMIWEPGSENPVTKGQHFFFSYDAQGRVSAVKELFYGDTISATDFYYSSRNAPDSLAVEYLDAHHRSFELAYNFGHNAIATRDMGEQPWKTIKRFTYNKKGLLVGTETRYTGVAPVVLTKRYYTYYKWWQLRARKGRLRL